MSSSLSERGSHIDEIMREEDGHSRDSGFSSGRVSPEPKDHDFTNIKLDESLKTTLTEGLEMLHQTEERTLKTQISHRIPLADCTNTSYSSQGSGKSQPRSAKHRIPDSPVTTFNTISDGRLLSFSMLETDSQTERHRSFTVFDESMASVEMTSIEGSSSATRRSQTTLRRTMSEYADRPSRKRSSESSSEHEKKRSRALVMDFDAPEFDDVFLDTSVNDDISPNVSSWSVVSQPRPVTRATSCGVLEMGEHNSFSPPPKMTEVYYSLPTVQKPQIDSQAFRSISAQVLAQELRIRGDEGFRNTYTLIDCRYPYEYDGGHIRTSLNIHDQNELEAFFFPDDMNDAIRKRIPIFYCEYSQKRGPGMAHRLRSLDRKRNELNYPEVDYKEIYLLDCGYQRFFKEMCEQSLCEPDAYVAMLAPKHSKQLSTFKWHKSKSSHHLERAAGGADRQFIRRRTLFTRHQSLMQISQDGKTPRTSRSRSILSQEDLTVTETPLAQRLNFEDVSPDNSTCEDF